eukprot:scaffold71263_cov65-Phaeocystis_antarctica.AAC.1
MGRALRYRSARANTLRGRRFRRCRRSRRAGYQPRSAETAACRGRAPSTYWCHARCRRRARWRAARRVRPTSSESGR